MKNLAYIAALILFIGGIFSATALFASGINLIYIWSDLLMGLNSFVQALIVLGLTLLVSKYLYKYSKLNREFLPIYSLKYLLNFLGRGIYIIGWSGLGLVTVISIYNLGTQLNEYVYEGPLRWSAIPTIKDILFISGVCVLISFIIIWWGKQIIKWSGN